MANGSDIGRYKSQLDVFDIAVIANYSLFLLSCLCFPASGGVGSGCTSARGSIGETSRAYCPNNDCCHAHEDQEPAELKKIKKVY